MGHSGKKQGTQAMHLQGQKQRRRTTGAATMQEKETLVVEAKKMHSNSHQHEAKNWGLPAEVQKRALGGEASLNQPEKKQRAYTSRSAQSWQERNSARDLQGHGVCSGQSVPSRHVAHDTACATWQERLAPSLRHTLRRLKG